MNEVDKAVDNLYDWSTRLKYISVILSALGEVLRVRHDRKNLQKLLFPERTFLASYPRQDFPGGFADIRNARRPDAAQYATVSRKDRQSVEIYIYIVLPQQLPRLRTLHPNSAVGLQTPLEYLRRCQDP